MSTSPQTAELEATPESLPDWKQEINARLSAHRTRRGAFASQQPTLPGMEAAAEPVARAARVAARVAERYAKAPTYSEMLAAEAANAARAAEAAAQAAREAHQAAQAVSDVLWAGVESGLDTEPAAEGTQGSPRAETASPDPAQYRVDPASLPAARRSPPARNQQSQSVDPHPHITDPFEEALVAPAQPLPARVLEFPRELVATRKARPRIAEGPLRDANAAPDKEQLRIFEVEPETISRQPDPTPAPEGALVPGWSSIRLDAAPRHAEPEMSAPKEPGKSMPTAQGRGHNHGAPFSSRSGQPAASKDHRHKSPLSDLLSMPVASIGDRLTSAVVDAVLVLSALLLFLLVFAACTPHLPAGKPAAIATAVAGVGLFALYQWLFFTYAEATPGMRYAKIALCTFDDENPDRKTLQHRIGAFFLAALPLGLGFLWALLDDDRLGWHDRMTRTYQRSYR